MVYQQKLLLILSILISSTAILAGLRQFRSTSGAANIEALSFDLLHAVGQAQSYYFRPKILNGGDHSFVGLFADDHAFEKLLTTNETENGTFTLRSTGDQHSLIIQAVGHYDGNNDGQNMTMEAKVFPKSYDIAVVNH